MEKLKQRTAAVISIVGASFMIASCSSGAELENGVPAVVVGHEYDDRDAWTSMIFTGKTMIPITNVDPEHFYLNVEQCGHEGLTDNNAEGCGVFSVEVGSETYHSYSDGDQVVFGDN